jgi:hypothetical protein
MTEAVISEVFKRPPLWDHRNEDCQNMGFVDTDLRRTTAKNHKTKKIRHLGESQENEVESAFSKDATSAMQGTK